MRRLTLRLAVAAAALACTAGSAPPVPVDDLTVSGRFELPHAEGGPWAGRLRLASVLVTAPTSDALGLKPKQFHDSFASAVEKSLRNFGYLASDDVAQPIPITAELMALETTREDDATRVAVFMRFAPADPAADPRLACEARTEFKALPPTDAGGGQRTFGLAATVALSALLVPAGSFLHSQLDTASQNNKAINARRRDNGEAVSPGGSELQMSRFAATNAMRLVIAGYLERLGSGAGCPPASAS